MAADPANDLVSARIVRILPSEDSAAVVLEAEDKKFVIVVGIFEAAALMRELRQDRPERPLTHDVIQYLMTGFDIRVSRIVISAIVNGVFCGTLVLERDRDGGGGMKDEVRLDIRASDSLVLALKTKSPIWVARRVLDDVEDMSSYLDQIDQELSEDADTPGGDATGSGED